MFSITSGDDDILLVELYRDKASFSISAGATVQAALVTSDRNTLIAGPVTCLNTTSGADWNNSLVAVPFTSDDTIKVRTFGNHLLEIQVDDSGKQTYTAPITILKGNV